MSSHTCKEHLLKPVLTNLNNQLSLMPPSRTLTPRAAALGVQPQSHHSKVRGTWLRRRVSSSPPDPTALHSALGFSRDHACCFFSVALPRCSARQAQPPTQQVTEIIEHDALALLRSIKSC